MGNSLKSFLQSKRNELESTDSSIIYSNFVRFYIVKLLPNNLPPGKNLPKFRAFESVDKI